MKKQILFLSALVVSTISLYGQKQNQLSGSPIQLETQKVHDNSFNLGGSRASTCLDTIRYPQIKEQLIGTSAFYNFTVWQADAESISQTYTLSGSSMTISRVEFFGGDNPGGAASVTVQAAIYSVDGANNPLALLGSGTVTINDTNNTYRYVTLATPVVVSNNYAVVLTPTSANGILRMFVSDATPGQTYDENFSRFKSAWYPNSNNNWVNIPTLTTGDAANFPGGPYDFEGLISPIVSYDINTSFTALPSTVCEGDPITFTNTTTPASILSSRMYNYQGFNTYFGLAVSDSTYLWDMDDANVVWQSSHSYTYASSGAFDPALITFGGLWNSCVDFAINPVTINAVDDATFTYPSTALCTTDANPTPTINATGVFSADLPGLVFANTATGEINIAASTPGVYEVTFQTAGICPAMTSTTMTLTTTPTIVASVDDATICNGESTNISASGAASYTWDNGLGAGANHTVSPTANTTYEVTGTTVGCSNTATVMVNVNPMDDASFAYSSNTLCLGGGNETPSINETGTFSATPAGLVFIDNATGEIDMTNSNETTYSVTFTTSGLCPNMSSQNITITSTPDADFTYSQAEYCASDANQSPIFGMGASSGVFSVDVAGLSIGTSTGVINISASTPGDYQVTNTIAASGACPMDAATVNVTVHALPTAVITGGGSYCDNDATPIELMVALSGEGPWNFTYTDGVTPVNVSGAASSPSTVVVTAAGTYTVSSVSDANCANTGAGSAIVVINAAPTVGAGSDVEVCEGTQITLNGTGAATYDWDNSVEDDVPFTQAPGVVTYTVIGTDGNGCENSASVTVTVNENPTVTMSALAMVCEGGAQVALTGGMPAGGTYTGTGVSGGMFNPATAGIGTHTITYTFVDAEGCSGQAQESIEVDGCAGIDNNFFADLSVFPNPTSSVLTVSFFNNQNIEVGVRMLTADGKTVVSHTASPMTQFEEKLDVSNLSNGVYFLHIQSAIGTHVEKIIVQ